MPIFYIQYHAEPNPESEAFRGIGGAYVNCWVKAASEMEAIRIATTSIQERKWKILSVEEECQEVTEASYSEDQEELAYYRQASLDEECYVYHQWPNEPQDEDAVH